MELNNYPISKEEEYDVMAERINLLAEALAGTQTVNDLPKSKELSHRIREVLQFFKRLI